MDLSSFRRAVLEAMSVLGFAALASGCALNPPAKSNPISGVWEGPVRWSSNKVLEDRDGLTTGTYDTIFISCGNTGLILVREPSDGTYSAVELPHTYKNGTNQIFFSVEQSAPADPDWVESQVWSFAILSGDALLVYWSRVVTNPKLKAEDHFRSFTQGGTGTLNKVSDDCKWSR